MTHDEPTQPNLETPRRGVLLFVTPLAILIAAIMFLFFSDDWTAGRIIGEVVFVAIALGLLAATVAPQRGAWGIRLVTFILFLVYLGYLLYEFLFSGQQLELSGRPEPSPFKALLGFLFFGIPCLLYTMWGSTWGRLGHVKPSAATTSDRVVYLVAWGAQILFLLLSAVAIVAVIFRSIEY